MLIEGCNRKDAVKEPIKIGAVLSITGFGSVYGENSRNGIELAVKEINEAGGVKGRPLKVIYEDDATDGKTAVTIVNKFISVDNVDAIIGGTWDLSLEPIVPIVEDANLLIINPSTGNTKKDSRLSPQLFRTWPSIHYQVSKFEPIVKKESIKTAVIFRNNGPWAFSHKTNLEELLEKNRGKLIEDFVGVNIDNNDFRSEISKAKVLQPDAVFLAVGYNDAANIVKRMKEQGFKAIILSSEGSLNDALDLGLVSVEDADGSYMISLRAQDKEFIEKYKKEYGKKPGVSADTAYAALKILAEAYEETGTTETNIIRQYLQGLPLFDENGDALHAVPIYKVEKGTRILQEE